MKLDAEALHRRYWKLVWSNGATAMDEKEALSALVAEQRAEEREEIRCEFEASFRKFGGTGLDGFVEWLSARGGK